MTGKRLLVALGTLVSLATLAAFASLLGGRERELSIDVWIAVVCTWLAVVLLHRLTSATPMAKDRLRSIFFWRKRRGEAQRDRGPEIVLEGLLINARDSDRAMALRLRPRLVELSGHLLRTRHGIDIEAQPERAADRLGDLWWLVDEHDTEPRSPSFDQIDDLLDLLLDETNPR